MKKMIMVGTGLISGENYYYNPIDKRWAASIEENCVFEPGAHPNLLTDAGQYRGALRLADVCVHEVEENGDISLINVIKYVIRVKERRKTSDLYVWFRKFNQIVSLSEAKVYDSLEEALDALDYIRKEYPRAVVVPVKVEREISLGEKILP